MSAGARIGPAPTAPVHAAPAAAIAVEGLRVRRGGTEVLHGVSFSVPAGAITGLCGPSGCGKSTLMRALVGVQRGVSGELRVLGRVPGSSALRQEIGYLTQASSLYTDLSVSENLSYFAALVGASGASIAAARDAVGLGEVRHRPVRALSGGQQVRVSLALALLGDPKLLILDEPTVGLDPILRRDLWALFRRLAARGRTLLVSSHVMDEARHCDTVLLLRDGRLIWRDSPAALTDATGTQDLDAAFVAIIEGAAAGGAER